MSPLWPMPDPYRKAPAVSVPVADTTETPEQGEGHGLNAFCIVDGCDEPDHQSAALSPTLLWAMRCESVPAFQMPARGGRHAEEMAARANAGKGLRGDDYYAGRWLGTAETHAAFSRGLERLFGGAQ